MEKYLEYVEMYISIKKANPTMEDNTARWYAAFYIFNRFLKLPIIYNPPENMFDVTSWSDESRNSAIRYYVKGWNV